MRPALQATLVVSIFVVIWGLTTHGKYSATGDEPHYLMVAESLRADGDLDLSNNYTARAGRRFGREDLEAGPHARIDRYGALLPVHDIGLPILVLPVYSLAAGVAALVPESTLRRFRMNTGLLAYSIVSLWMLTICCLGVWLLGLTVSGFLRGWNAVVLVAGLALSPPILTNSFLVFPEIPAFLVCCLVLWASFGRGRERQWPMILALWAIGVLPWFHRKFALFGIGLAVVWAWANWSQVKRHAVAWTAAGVVLVGLPLAALVAWSVTHWGNPGGALVAVDMPFSWSALRAGLPGLMIDRENGLLVWAPIYALVPVAWWLTRQTTWTLLLPVILLVGPSAAHDQWWGGFSPAARFLMPLTPCFVLVYAAAAHRAGLRATLVPLAALQAFVSGYGWQHPRALWPQGDGHNRVLEALPFLGPRLSQALPSLRTAADGVAVAMAWLTLVAGLNVVVLLQVARRRRSA